MTRGQRALSPEPRSKTPDPRSQRLGPGPWTQDPLMDGRSRHIGRSVDASRWTPTSPVCQRLHLGLGIQLLALVQLALGTCGYEMTKGPRVRRSKAEDRWMGPNSQQDASPPQTQPPSSFCVCVGILIAGSRSSASLTSNSYLVHVVRPLPPLRLGFGMIKQNSFSFASRLHTSWRKSNRISCTKSRIWSVYDGKYVVRKYSIL